MKKVILGSMMFLAGLLSAAVLLAGTMANDWSVNGELSSFRNMVQYGLMPVFYIFIGVSVACGYFRKRRYGNGSMFSFVFAVNPLYSVINGAFAGKDVKHLWSLPVISAVLFLIGTWIFFDMGETAFILYAAVYLVIGIMAMLISMFIPASNEPSGCYNK